MPPRIVKKSAKKRQVKRRPKKKKKSKEVVRRAVKKVEVKDEPLPVLSKLKSCSWDWQTKRLEGMMDDVRTNEAQNVMRRKEGENQYIWSLVFKPEGSKVDMPAVWGSREEMGDFVPDTSGVYVFAPYTNDKRRHYTYCLKRLIIVNQRNGEKEVKYVRRAQSVKLVDKNGETTESD